MILLFVRNYLVYLPGHLGFTLWHFSCLFYFMDTIEMCIEECSLFGPCADFVAQTLVSTFGSLKCVLRFKCSKFCCCFKFRLLIYLTMYSFQSLIYFWLVCFHSIQCTNNFIQIFSMNHTWITQLIKTI